MKDLPPPTACMSAAMMVRSGEHICPATPASARAHTKDGNQHGTENIFLFLVLAIENENCVSDTNPSDCEASHRSKSSLASGPDIRGMSGQQLAVCSRMRTPVWITSIRTQPETFSFTLLTSAGSKLKSCSPPLR